MNFFRAYYDQEDQIVDVFKQIDFGNIIETDQYELYQPLESDNLMSIAHRFYRNVDDAWILYFYNKMSDAMFSIVPRYIVDVSVEGYADNIIDYDDIAEHDQKICEELVREYYLQDYDFAAASKKAIETLKSPSARVSTNFIIPFKDYLYEQIIVNEKISNPIKIPQMKVVLQMKAYMNRYSIAWREN